MKDSNQPVDRKQILRGIYEENLRTVRNEPPPARREPKVRPSHKPQRTGALLAFALILAAGFAYGSIQSAVPEAAGRAATPLLETGGSSVSSVVDRPRRNPISLHEDVSIASLYGLSVKTIVIDAGHGGRDPGTVGAGGTREKDVTLDVALLLKERLERRYGYRILLTRDQDAKISLRDRVDFANLHQTDLFVSLHVNWVDDSLLTGLETYYFGPRADEATRSIAQRENEDDAYSVAEFNEMLAEIGQTMKLEESQRLATAIQQSLFSNVKHIDSSVSDWGVKRAPFVVLLGVDAPGVLAEIACINNAEQEIQLRSRAYREKLAIFLEEGIVTYLTQGADQYESSKKDVNYAAASEN